MSQLDDIIHEAGDYGMDETLDEQIVLKAKQQIKDLMLKLIGKNPKGDHEVAEGVRQYQAELRKKVDEL